MGFSMNYFYKTVKSPVGNLKLVASKKGLAAILWPDDDATRMQFLALSEDKRHPVLIAAEQQLAEYFAGKRKKFSLKLDFIGTPFQKRVWKEMLNIPYGATKSYGQLAKNIGKPNASRAVGGANRKNPISIVAPCHRVIGANGKLTGFAGGLAAKEFLLKLECSN